MADSSKKKDQTLTVKNVAFVELAKKNGVKAAQLTELEKQADTLTKKIDTLAKNIKSGALDISGYDATEAGVKEFLTAQIKKNSISSTLSNKKTAEILLELFKTNGVYEEILSRGKKTATPTVDDVKIEKPVSELPPKFVFPANPSVTTNPGTTKPVVPHAPVDNGIVRQQISNSLIPIKGISKKLHDQLGKHKIFDVVSLLSKCATENNRKNIAAILGINVRHIEMWVKQADLWRVDGMSTDLAFFLAQAGVRSYIELGKIDVKKIYPIIENLAYAQPDYVKPELDDVSAVIENAKKLTTIDFDAFKAFVTGKAAGLDWGKLEEWINSRTDCNPYGIEPEPNHLYKDDVEIEDNPTSNEKFQLCWIDLDFTLPLPRKIQGFVYTKNGAPYEGLKVELDGVVSPAEDKTEAAENPSCVTDASGRFIITMPERYCFKETVKVIISNEFGSQTFIKNSSEIIESMEDTVYVDMLQQITELRVAARLAHRNDSSKSVADIFNDGYGKFYNDLSGDEKKIADKIKSAFENIKNEQQFDETALKLFNTKVKGSNLIAFIEGEDRSSGNDGFVVDESKFVKTDPHGQSALPSVKLMGDDEHPVMLSTDRAPSRVFSYSMLQRLIEPKLVSKQSSEEKRKALNEPVDVAGFKESLYKDPLNFPQMASLGLGYQLNMHQAWIPDGFALGDLLYSLILAPGEEQRLVVTEKKQSYTVSDSAEGTDNVSENYEASQLDDESATYNYAVNQVMNANSSFETSSKSWGIGASTGATGHGSYGTFSGSAMLGISGGYSKSSSKGSSKAHQQNSQNEASSAAQRFQHSVKSASNRLAQAKRISVSTASSDVSNSVATKIIANHNHSHAMTMQYWEVMRRYRLETAIDSVDLVLFVPMKIIEFLGKKTDLVMSETDGRSFDKSMFNKRYANVLKYIDAIESALPYSYRSGIRLIKQYAANPHWELQKEDAASRTVTLSFKGNYLAFDDITVTVYLKNGRGCISAYPEYTRESLSSKIASRDDLKQYIREMRNRKGNVSVKCSIVLPSDVSIDDIHSIKVGYSCDDLTYTLYQGTENLTEAQLEAWNNVLDKEMDFAKDDKSSSKDLRRIAHYMERLPEAFTNPNVKFSASVIKALGAPSIYDVSVSLNGNNVTANCSSNTLSRDTRIVLTSEVKTLKRSELQKMEETFRHIVTDTLRYSQVVWSSMSTDELAMILDQYNMDMDFSKLEARCPTEGDKKDGVAEKENEATNISLLNCINVRKPLGFYGNCMLFPFTFPRELAQMLNRTAADIQDQIYRYHTNSFRAPTTVVSLPTKGMIGEAVLGQTNVSEVIDLTRFWNWQDSPIDKMDITKDYLDSKDYLENKKTQEIKALGIESASAPEAVTVPDLLKALVSKQTPSFSDLTGQDQLATLQSGIADKAASGLSNMLNSTTTLLTKALETDSAMATARINADKEIEVAKLGGGKKDAAAGAKDGAKDGAAAGAKDGAAGGAAGGAKGGSSDASKDNKSSAAPSNVEVVISNNNTNVNG